MKMEVCTTIEQFNRVMEQLPANSKVAFVPTMGALHEGHLSLIRRGREISQYLVVTIFVNPTQFNDPQDLERYPRTPQKDIEKLKREGVYALLLPSVEEIYPEGVESGSIKVDLEGLDRYGEGAKREGHFEGVVEVVGRLFDIVKPTHALFGEKDFQQLAIVKKMVENRGYPIEVVAVETMREENGLAMSSRNELLSPKEREEAALIYRVLKEGVKLVAEKQLPIDKITTLLIDKIEENPLFKCDYLLFVDGETLQPINEIEEGRAVQLTVAVNIGAVRVIDNIKVN